MSIIEETLNRLSEERTKQVPSHHGSSLADSESTSVSEPPDKLPGDDFNALPWSVAQTRTQKGKMSRLPAYVAFLAVGVSALAWFGIQFLENPGSNGSAKRAQVAETMPQPVAVASIDSQAVVAKPTESPVVTTQDATAETSTPPASPTVGTPVASEAVPLSNGPVERTKPTTQAVATGPADVTPAVKPVDAQSLAVPAVAVKPAELDSSAQSIRVPASTASQLADKPTTITPVATQAPRVGGSASEDSVSLPSWISEGRRLMDAKDIAAAFKVWNQGFGALPTQQRIVAVAAFYDQSPALAALKTLDGFQNAMVVSGSYAGRSAWYLLLYSRPEAQKDDLARAMVLTGIKGGAVTGVGRISQVVPVLDQVSRAGAGRSSPVVNPEKSTLTKSADKAPVLSEHDGESITAKEHVVPVTKNGSAPQIAKKGGKEPSAAVGEAGVSSGPVINVLYESQLEQIAKAFNSGRYKESEELARTTLDQNPSSPTAWLWVGKTVLARGQFDDAERHLAHATELSPNLAEAWTLRGISAQESGNHAQALKYFGESLRAQPNQAEAYFNMGYSNDALGNHSEAEGNWRRFLEIVKDKPRYARQRSFVEQHLGAPARQE